MAASLQALIETVESEAASSEALDLLGTASATVAEMTELTDALLSHFVDRCRRAGHSWADIGTSLGVTRQAVQKRFTGERRNPAGWERFTDRARRVVGEHAAAVAEELSHNYVGTEHILAAIWGEPEGVAAQALESLGLTRQTVIAGIDARVARGQQSLGGFTPRAWIAMENATKVADEMGHSYVGTEHVLLSLMRGIGGMAESILNDGGVSHDAVEGEVRQLLRGYQTPL